MSRLLTIPDDEQLLTAVHEALSMRFLVGAELTGVIMAAAALDVVSALRSLCTDTAVTE